MVVIKEKTVPKAGAEMRKRKNEGEVDTSSHVAQGLLVNLSNKRESRSVAVWPSLVVPSEEWFIPVLRTGKKKSWESLGPVWRG